MTALPILPSYVRDATDLARLVRLGTTYETLVLEFKTDFPNGWTSPKSEPKRGAQKELCRDVAQFANTFGGCILYGVAEQEVDGSRVASSFAPIADFDDRRDWLQQTLRNFLVPSTLTVQLERVDIPGGCLMAVNVPPSLHLVSLWDQQTGTIECLYRTNHGKAYMNPDEAEQHLMNGSRAAGIAFAEAIQECGGMTNGLDVSIASGVVVRERNPQGALELRPLPHSGRLVGFHPKQITLKIAIGDENCPALNIPMGLVRAAWPVKTGELGVMLDVKIVWDRGTKTVSLSGER
jgi:hypothetical protein